MLRIVYRSYGGENAKNRPQYYGKLLSMLSMVRSVEAFDGPAELIYFNDGPIPADRLSVMERTGQVVARDAMGNKGSVRASLALPAERGWASDDVVWYSEDDYLYLPRAMGDLAEAARLFPDASYFGLYASIGDRPPEGGTQPDYAPVPAAWRDSEPVLVNGHPWRRALSTCATFGARAGVLAEDRALFHASLLTGAGWDHTMCLLYQGYRPFPWPLVTLHAHQARGPYAFARGLAVAGVRMGVNAYQAVRARRGAPARLLIAPDPPLATHLENDHLGLGTDWTAEAELCWRWALERGYATGGTRSVA